MPTIRNQMNKLDPFEPPLSLEDRLQKRLEEFGNGPTSNPKLKIGIGLEGGFVKLDFSRPVEKIIITKQQARELSRRLIQVTIK